METNFFGPVLLARAFAPVLAAKRGTVLIDVHSVASWYAFGGAYNASNAALWSATNSLRIEFASLGVHVTGVHMGYVDTDTAARADGPKMLPTQLVTTVYDAVEAGEHEVLADELTKGGQGGSERSGRSALPGPARHGRLSQFFDPDVISSRRAPVIMAFERLAGRCREGLHRRGRRAVDDIGGPTKPSSPTSATRSTPP